MGGGGPAARVHQPRRNRRRIVAARGERRDGHGRRGGADATPRAERRDLLVASRVLARVLGGPPGPPGKAIALEQRGGAGEYRPAPAILAGGLELPPHRIPQPALAPPDAVPNRATPPPRRRAPVPRDGGHPPFPADERQLRACCRGRRDVSDPT